jgi:adenine-specific DNA-methyltransferase
MPTPREKFQELLKKLFQFDCAELDFGIYRIINQKRAVIERFIEKDLLDAVAMELSSGALAQQSGLAQQFADVTAQIRENFGEEALDAEGNLDAQYRGSKRGKQYLELRERAGKAKSSPELEAVIFNHLYAFFSRYYDEGDFMSLRRYSKRDKYAIPYNGEEVHLHWANSDQYYIKTGENFTDYSYKHNDWTVRFKLRNADVEQDNVQGAKRFFIPRTNELVFDDAAKTVMLPFEFRPLKAEEEVGYGRGNKGEAENGTAENGSGKEKGKKKKGQDGILADALATLIDAARKYPQALVALMTTKRMDADDNPVSLVEHHLRAYTRANTSDFFIHKDLKGFLNRELDFYLKNEALNLDELEAGGEARAENWFQLLRTIKAIGRKIIIFVSQIEDFQKKLFEKKKFVSEVHYCLTLDRVPEELYPEIAKNKAQIEEWKRLFHVQEIERDTTQSGFKEPVKVDFLKVNDNLVLDTRFFDANFKDRLLSALESIDDSSDGLLVQSENFHALQMLESRFRSQISCIYIDPPYNSDAGPISYKNGYQHSSWLALLENRIRIARRFLDGSAIMCITIDDNEAHRLRCLCERVLPDADLLGVVAIKNNPAGRTATVGFSVCHEYAFFYGQPGVAKVNRLEHSEAQKARYSEKDAIGFFEWTNFRKHGGLNTYRTARPRQFYPIYVQGTDIRIPKITWDEGSRKWIVNEKPKADEEVLWPIDEKGRERIWDFVAETARKNLDHFKVRKDSHGATAIYRKWRINEEGLLPQTWWDKSEYSAPEYGTNLLTNLFGSTHEFMFPKSVYAVADCLKVSGLRSDQGGTVLDFFAGSGTTGHAVINLNRQDGGSRRYLLVESGDYFDDVLVSRLKKVAYSKDWKNGKPVSRRGSSHAFKYLRLESYEDALDNITFQAPDNQATLQLEDYVLSYMLDFGTKQSDTLLNVAKLDVPFDYTLHRHGKDEPSPVDLPETFNYLIGLNVASRRVYENRGVRYLVYRGRAEDRDTVILWRTTRGWKQEQFEADRDFVAKQKLTEGVEDIYVNTDSFIPNARSLDLVFKRRMFNEE